MTKGSALERRDFWCSTFKLLDLCVSSSRRGHADLLCIVPISTNDPRMDSICNLLSDPFWLRKRGASEISGSESHPLFNVRSCHILPFQPIVWNRHFPSELVRTAKAAPNPFQIGVGYGNHDVYLSAPPFRGPGSVLKLHTCLLDHDKRGIQRCRVLWKRFIYIYIYYIERER